MGNKSLNTIVVETVKQLRSITENTGIERYSRMKKDQSQLIETKTVHTFVRIPKQATKKRSLSRRNNMVERYK